MENYELDVRLRLSIQRALLGQISETLRLITVESTGLELLHIVCYFSSEPTEEQIEDMNIVSTEILADIDFSQDRVECSYSTLPMAQLPRLRHTVFARKE